MTKPIVIPLREGAPQIPEAQRLEDRAHAKGDVSLIWRYSDLYHLRSRHGEIFDVQNIGNNLFLAQGRYIAAGHLLGTSVGASTVVKGGAGWGTGFTETTGHVIRGMALGTGDTVAADGDTALVTPVPNTVTGDYYFEIDAAEFPDLPSTEVTLIRTFSATQPTNTSFKIKELGLYTAVPIAASSAWPVTTPPGPVTSFTGGALTEPYLVARKVVQESDQHVPKSPDFTLTVRWRIRY